MGRGLVSSELGEGLELTAEMRPRGSARHRRSGYDVEEDHVVSEQTENCSLSLEGVRIDARIADTQRG